MAEFNPCLVVPVYNHGLLAKQLAETCQKDLPLFLIDDGSTVETTALMEAGRLPHVRLLRHGHNQGKGSAVMTGLRAALDQGFSHALQIDGDGQHALEDIPRFLAQAEATPDGVVCGYPIFDGSVPKGRLIGRYLTHFWVWVETLSFDIKDSMCGFRVYPLRETVAMVNRAHVGTRMDFDSEILVRLHWAGLSIKFLPTHVVYPEGGRSNFRLLADNWLITRMHTRLFFGMLSRLPGLLVRRFS